MTFLQAAGTGTVSAEELARAQDRESLQALLATTLRRRESLTRQLAALKGPALQQQQEEEEQQEEQQELQHFAQQPMLRFAHSASGGCCSRSWGVVSVCTKTQ